MTGDPSLEALLPLPLGRYRLMAPISAELLGFAAALRLPDPAKASRLWNRFCRPAQRAGQQEAHRPRPEWPHQGPRARLQRYSVNAAKACIAFGRPILHKLRNQYSQRSPNERKTTYPAAIARLGIIIIEITTGLYPNVLRMSTQPRGVRQGLLVVGSPLPPHTPQQENLPPSCYNPPDVPPSAAQLRSVATALNLKLKLLTVAPCHAL